MSLEPKEPYTPLDLDYDNPKASVYVELQTRLNVPLKNAVISNFQRYKNVIIGYPIWWYEPSWVIDEFLKSNNFNGKKLIVFATSASSGIGNSAEILAKKANGGDLVEKRGFEMIDEVKIKAWLDKVRKI